MGRRPALLSNQDKGALMRQQILAVAVPLIAQKGGRGVSLAEVAAASNLSKAGLLHHFGTKEALLHAALDVRDAEDGYPRLWPTDIGLGILDQIVLLARRWNERPPSLGMFTSLTTENLPVGSPLHDRVTERLQTVQQRIVETIEAGKLTGQFRLDLDENQCALETQFFTNGLELLAQLQPEARIIDIAEKWRAARIRDWGAHPARLAT